MQQASACGKIILSGEYAVIFGKPGIGTPSRERLVVTWEKDSEKNGIHIVWNDVGVTNAWLQYVQRIISMIEKTGRRFHGKLTIQSAIPLGKGMGSSTALNIALCRAFIGNDCEETAKTIEDALTPDNSGIDFAIIWGEKTILYTKGMEPKILKPPNELATITILDTGTPNETTAELVAWIKSRSAVLEKPIESIGHCSERIVRGESLKEIVRDHHRAQVLLGVVPEKVQKIIEDIESQGGAAKVIGAGGRTGGGGMVLVIR